jgi:hypothetical protein
VAAFSVKNYEGSNAEAALPPDGQLNPTGCQIREIVVKDHPLVSLVIPITVEGLSTSAVLDTASHVTIVNRDILGEMNLPMEIEKVKLRQASGTDFMDGYVVQEMSLKIDGHKYKGDLVVASISDPVLHITFKKSQHVGFTSESDAICADLGRDPKVESEHTHAVQVDVDVKPEGLLRSNAVAAFSLDSSTSDQIASGSLRESITPSLQQVSIGFEETHLGTNAVAALTASVDTEGTPNIHSGSLPSNTSSQTLEKFPEHLEDLYKHSCENLTNEQSVRVAKLLLEFSEIFAKHDLDLGCMIGVEHHINTGDAKQM